MRQSAIAFTQWAVEEKGGGAMLPRFTQRVEQIAQTGKSGKPSEATANIFRYSASPGNFFETTFLLKIIIVINTTLFTATTSITPTIITITSTPNTAAATTNPTITTIAYIPYTNTIYVHYSYS